MPLKLTYTFVKTQIESEGYTLLSKEYISSGTRLEYMCPKGHIHSTSWDNWKAPQNHRCEYCYHEKRANKSRKPFVEIKNTLESEGYKVLIEEAAYRDTSTILDFICPNGHKSHIRWNSWQKGSRCGMCWNENRSNEKAGGYKRGVSFTKVPLYATYGERISRYHRVSVIFQDNLELLGVECLYCGRVFVPSIQAVQDRLSSASTVGHGENNFYCSKNCKISCPTFGQKLYPKGYKPDTSREVQPALRKVVLHRDNYQCQICSKSINDSELHCHHIESINNNPIESADIDNCITLCKKCHTSAHKQIGCRYSDLQCKKY